MAGGLFSDSKRCMEYLLVDRHNGVADITLNRPDKRNALSPGLVGELRDVLADLRGDASVKVVVLQGSGKAFCAGADLAYLQQLADFSVLENMSDSRLLQETLHALYTFPRPVVAKVHGPAIAGGCGLATVCDFIVAGRERAVFGYSEVKIGFIPAIVMVYLVRKIGDTQARRLLLSAEQISADEALRLGMITHVADDAALDGAVQSLVDTLLANSSSAMMLTKEMLNNVHGMSLDAGLRYASSMNALARQTDDCRSGIARFLNK